jgi:hypothetical protein
MRTFLVTCLLAATALAGCTDNADSDSLTGDLSATLNLGINVPGTPGTHPDFGFPTEGLIPMTTDGQTRVVNEDGTVSWFRPLGQTWSGLVPVGMETVANTQATVTNADGVEVGVEGHGIAVFGPLAVYGGASQSKPPLLVVDFTDPSNPVELGRNDDVPVRDAGIIAFPDGRLVVITTGGGSVQYATEITDPTNPTLLAETETAHGNHNIAVVPGTPIVYNTGSNGMIDIYDYTDPAEPEAVGTFYNGHGCHDITFFMSPEASMFRAYCAASSGARSQIWDIADPTQPQMLLNMAYPAIESGVPVAGEKAPASSGRTAPLSIDHLLMVNHDATVMILGDEMGGGGIPPGCDVSAEVAGESYSGPYGNLWFYDISDEANPELLGHISPSAFERFTEADPAAAAAGSCTAHFGELVEDTGFLAMSFYSSGVLLVDFRDPANPLITDQLVPAGGSTWDVQYQDGWLLTGDMARGLDVLKLI